MFIKDSGFEMELRIGSAKFENTDAFDFSVDQWYYVTFTADGSDWNFYIDGTLDTTWTTATLPSNTNSRPLTFGRPADAREFFQGKQDENSLRNSAVDAEWVDATYNTGNNPSGFAVAGTPYSPPSDARGYIIMPNMGGR